MAVLDKYSDDWNVFDHPVSFANSYYSGPIRDAPICHKTSWITRYIGEVTKESYQCLVAGAEIAPAITSLVAIDYLAGFFAGKRTNRHDYMAFIRQFFPSIYSPFAEQIYFDLRCGLLHNLVVMNPWTPTGSSFKITRDSVNHLKIEDGHIVWSVRTVLEHISRAWAMFAHHLIMDAPDNAGAVERFHRRFDQNGGVSALMAKSTP